MLTSDLLLKFPGISHGFFSREGGVSKGDFSSLNCAFLEDDNPEHVEENRKRAAIKLKVPSENILTTKQVHGTRVVFVTSNKWVTNEPPEADALITSNAKIAIGVLTADCVPILLYDPAVKVISAIHAGWKGALDGVIEKTIEFMRIKGTKPENIIAAIGPCVHKKSYEVDQKFTELFLEKDPRNSKFFSKKNTYFFDLPAYAKSKLNNIGVQKIDQLAINTAEDERFFSVRRNKICGRQISVIMMSS